MYMIMTFAPNGHPTPVEYKTYQTREEVEARLKELKIIYNNPIYISYKSNN